MADEEQRVENMEEGIQSPAPGTPDSRKRPLDNDNEDAISKKSHYIPGKSYGIWCNLFNLLCNQK